MKHGTRDEPDASKAISMRSLKVWRAGLAGIAGVGMGYLYIGRIRLAFAALLLLLGLFAVAGWTRLVLEPRTLYFFAAVVLTVALAMIIHPMLLARSIKSAPRSGVNRWWIYLVWILASVLSGDLLRAVRPVVFGFEPFRMAAGSMAPTLERGDYLMADTWRLKSADPEFGDLVVFDLPDNSKVRYLFRVVGLPGDTVELRDAKLYRNARLQREPYLPATVYLSDRSWNYGPITLDDSSFFVLGDNRDNARDSRYLGPVRRELLHGRIEHRWFAFDGEIEWDRFPERLSNDRP
ncbi:MAG: signal peptidase I [Pseudomonadota bacterium]